MGLAAAGARLTCMWDTGLVSHSRETVALGCKPCVLTLQLHQHSHESKQECHLLAPQCRAVPNLFGTGDQFSSSAGKEYTCSVGDLGSIPGLGRSTGEGNCYPLQYSGLENTMNCVVHEVAKNQT